jgi:hypothetical protein
MVEFYVNYFDRKFLGATNPKEKYGVSIPISFAHS